MASANAYPVKAFFASMLTRDIDLDDAILDLLDNCLDGVLRTLGDKHTAGARPYAGFWARIEFDEDHFAIYDNCGGISRETALNYAFLMGRPETPDVELPTVGAYGIGMKRALFKLGERSQVVSGTVEGFYTVNITPEWMKDDETWTLPLEDVERGNAANWLGPDEFGTGIDVRELYASTQKRLGSPKFFDSFIANVQTHYAYILEKGFSVSVNGVSMRPVQTLFLYGPPVGAGRIAPFVYTGTIGSVNISLIVGLYRQIVGEEELAAEALERRSADTSGWTLVCNDRVVLYNDKTLLTGWGETGIPAFHSQFIGIRGEVRFTSNNPLDLPLRTTKRGIDASSEIYLQIKNIMREGMKMFINYTNDWKGHNAEERTYSNSATPLRVWDATQKVTQTERPRHRENGEVYVPTLPRPKMTTSETWIRFVRPVREVNLVSNFLFDDDTPRKPGVVGDACFADVLARAKRDGEDG